MCDGLEGQPLVYGGPVDGYGGLGWFRSSGEDGDIDDGLVASTWSPHGVLDELVDPSHCGGGREASGYRQLHLSTLEDRVCSGLGGDRCREANEAECLWQREERYFLVAICL